MATRDEIINYEERNHEELMEGFCGDGDYDKEYWVYVEECFKEKDYND
jgi:hypothetical protein